MIRWVSMAMAAGQQSIAGVAMAVYVQRRIGQVAGTPAAPAAQAEAPAPP